MSDDMEERAGRLRLVPPPADDPIVTQVADFPDAYTVRSAGGVRALLLRERNAWLLLYAHDEAAEPDDAMQWREQALLPAVLTLAEAADVAVLIDGAYRDPNGMPVYARLLAAAYGTAMWRVLVDMVRLHRPASDAGAGRYSPCSGGESDAAGETVYWLDCPTVLALASALDITLPPSPD